MKPDSNQNGFWKRYWWIVLGVLSAVVLSSALQLSNTDGWISINNLNSSTNSSYVINWNTSRPSTCLVGNYSYWNGSSFLCNPDAGSGVDQNNYTSSISFSGVNTKTLDLGRNGASTLSSSFTDLYVTNMSINKTVSTVQINLARNGLSNLSATFIDSSGGGVTSVDASVLGSSSVSVSGNPITSSGTLVFTFQNATNLQDGFLTAVDHTQYSGTYTFLNALWGSYQQLNATVIGLYTNVTLLQSSSGGFYNNITGLQLANATQLLFNAGIYVNVSSINTTANIMNLSFYNKSEIDALLPVTYIMYYRNVSSDITGYRVMNSTYPTTPSITEKYTSVVDNQLVFNFSTANNTGFRTINSGNIGFHMHARQTGGTKTTYVYNHFFVRHYNGTEDIVCSSINSTTFLTSAFADVLNTCSTGGVSINSTSDRFVTKIYVTTVGGGSAPNIEFLYDDAEGSGTNLPVTLAAFVEVDPVYSSVASGLYSNITGLQSANATQITLNSGFYNNITSINSTSIQNIPRVVNASHLNTTLLGTTGQYLTYNSSGGMNWTTGYNPAGIYTNVTALQAIVSVNRDTTTFESSNYFLLSPTTVQQNTWTNTTARGTIFNVPDGTYLNFSRIGIYIPNAATVNTEVNFGIYNCTAGSSNCTTTNLIINSTILRPTATGLLEHSNATATWVLGGGYYAFVMAQNCSIGCTTAVYSATGTTGTTGNNATFFTSTVLNGRLGSTVGSRTYTSSNYPVARLWGTS